MSVEKEKRSVRNACSKTGEASGNAQMKASEGGIARSMLNAACQCAQHLNRANTNTRRPFEAVCKFVWGHRRLCKVASIACSDALVCLMMLAVPELMGEVHTAIARLQQRTGNCIN